MARVRSHGSSAWRCNPGEARQSAQCGAQREASRGACAVRADGTASARGALSARTSVSLDNRRFGERPELGDAGECEGLVPAALRRSQRSARSGRRHDATEARPLVEKYFGALQSGPPRTRVSRWVPRRSEPVRVVSYDRVAAPRITRAWTAPAFGDEEVPDMDLLARILGGGRSSRLYRELVADAQLATEVDVQNVTYEIAGVFMISITLAPNADVARAEAVLDRALAKFLREGPSRAELERARAEIAADFAIANESPATRGFVLAECELYTGTPGCIDHYFGRLRSAHPQRVRVRAADWLGEGYFQLEIRPFGTPQGLSDTVDRSRMPLPEQFPEAIPPHIETGRLSNGIEVTVVERRSSPLVRMAVVVAGGVAGGQAFSPGLAQLAWEMLGEEGEGAFAQIGARLHSRLARDWGILSFEVPADHFARAAELTAQSLIRPAFAADDLQRVRVLNRARLEQSISNP
ncbi:MAG TPA: insulinase family protein, partial [Steroidobacteraceae bacterium]